MSGNETKVEVTGIKMMVCTVCCGLLNHQVSFLTELWGITGQCFGWCSQICWKGGVPAANARLQHCAKAQSCLYCKCFTYL